MKERLLPGGRVRDSFPEEGRRDPGLRDGRDINGVDGEHSSGCMVAHGGAGGKRSKPEDGKDSHLG